ncbi:hypothetical protein PISL3812_01739 [Talaromyces islandicus]|uniref:Uncharacterized protein n=1 Tax=Talaromyces islandicus TaxID=28573 RepID=A0A0U1LQ50_TALIS|nr:hypothetical protein PISL3812_01739 [Talaromyces islandicus]
MASRAQDFSRLKVIKFFSEVYQLHVEYLHIAFGTLKSVLQFKMNSSFTNVLSTIRVAFGKEKLSEGNDDPREREDLQHIQLPRGPGKDIAKRSEAGGCKVKQYEVKHCEADSLCFVIWVE